MRLDQAFRVVQIVTSAKTPVHWHFDPKSGDQWANLLYYKASGLINQSWSSCKFTIKDLKPLKPEIRRLWLRRKWAYFWHGNIEHFEMRNRALFFLRAKT